MQFGDQIKQDEMDTAVELTTRHGQNEVQELSCICRLKHTDRTQFSCNYILDEVSTQQFTLMVYFSQLALWNNFILHLSELGHRVPVK
jgi:hypothetical protein